MVNTTRAPQRIVLLLAGVSIVFTGINVAFGGIRTLGWQGERAFFDVTNPTAFFAQDSHVRFLGGLWLGVGLFFILASTNLSKYRSALLVVLALIFLGGLARLTQMDLDTTLGPKIVGSFVAELVVIPILYFWLSRTVPEHQYS
jgi:hypothetical protein